VSSPALPHATPAEIELFRALLLNRTGMDLGRERQSFLLNRLQRRMLHSGVRNLYDYYRRLHEPGRGVELQALLDDVAIHETAFFRNPHQFALLAETVLAERTTARLGAGRRCLRIWSAGCSTGQEVDSLGIVVSESLILPPSWEFLLLGTDLSTRAVAEANRGTYTEAQMDGVSPERRRRFFDRRGEAYVVRPWVRRGVRLVRGNMVDETPPDDLDVIFCRNVMIYFDRETQARLLRRFASVLAPGGYLFLGHTESPAGQTDAFQMVVSGRAIAYRRLG
jgi:chemotaxis protein methyltransferase CheR